MARPSREVAIELSCEHCSGKTQTTTAELEARQQFTCAKCGGINRINLEEIRRMLRAGMAHGRSS